MSAVPNFPTIVAARYVPRRLIATGGMGAVYEVEHVGTRERLALKVLRSESALGASAERLQRFKREARVSALIKSEHVVRVLDADVASELDGAPFLVMEFLEGRNLEQEATATSPEPATVVEWLRQVAEALDKAHRLGIIHRDIKPENLFLARVEDRPPLVKLLDFGIAKMAEDGAGLTGTGQVVGTPRYMAPEQASSSPHITAATDRYALGLVAYRLLTGEHYYRGDVLAVLAQLLHEPMRAPSERHPGLGRDFDAWFARACHRQPEARFSTATEQIEALRSALGALPPARRHGAWPRRGAAVLLAASVLTALLVLGRPRVRPAVQAPAVQAASSVAQLPPLSPPQPIAAGETPPPPLRVSPAAPMTIEPPRVPRRQRPVRPPGNVLPASAANLAVPEAPPASSGDIARTVRPEAYADQK